MKAIGIRILFLLMVFGTIMITNITSVPHAYARDLPNTMLLPMVTDTGSQNQAINSTNYNAWFHSLADTGTQSIDTQLNTQILNPTSSPEQPSTVQANQSANQQASQPSTHVDDSQNGISYTVKRGDTLSEICFAYHIDLQSVVQLNNIANPSLLQTGQVIKIPSNPSNSTNQPVPQEELLRYQLGVLYLLAHATLQIGLDVSKEH